MNRQRYFHSLGAGSQAQYVPVHGQIPNNVAFFYNVNNLTSSKLSRKKKLADLWYIKQKDRKVSTIHAWYNFIDFLTLWIASVSCSATLKAVVATLRKRQYYIYIYSI